MTHLHFFETARDARASEPRVVVEGAGAPTRGGEALAECAGRRRELLLPAQDAMAGDVQRGQQAGVGRRREGRVGVRPLEEHRVLGERVQPRGRLAAVAVATEPVGPQAVDRDEQDAGPLGAGTLRARRRQRGGRRQHERRARDETKSSHGSC